MSPRRTAPPLLAACLLLAGCVGNPITDDPIDKPGTWAPTGDNEANLRVMVANPQDLVAGEAATGGLAVEAAPPVGLLLSGKRAALLTGDSSTGSGGGGGSTGGSGATPQ